MKKLILFSLLIAQAFIGFNQVDRSIVPQPGPAPKIQIGEYQTLLLENGLTVIVVENHKLPRVSYSIELNLGPIAEGNKVGYIEMAGNLLSAGTTTKTKAQIDEATDFIGAELSTYSGGIYGASLTKHSSRLLSLMSDILMNPTFPEDELEKVRKQTLSGLVSNKTDPNSISQVVGDIARFGNHPYGEFPTEASINAIQREDLLNYYNVFFRPNNAYLIIVGDITLATAKEQAKEYFGTWKKGPTPQFDLTKPVAPKANEVVFVAIPGAVQSVIDITYAIDLKPGTHDALSASVLNNILGGSGFQARLMQNLREDKAYTYGAYSGIESDQYVGYFTAGASVRNEVTDSSVTQILYEMQRLTKEPVADSMLQTIKNIMTGSFARSLERPQTVANFARNIQRYKLPKDYYETYLERLNAISAADVMAIAQKLLMPENCYITVVGNEEVKAKLKVFSKSGIIREYNPDGTIRKELKPIPAGVTVDTVLKNYINAIGGEKKLKKVKSYSQTGTMAAGPMKLNLSTHVKGNKIVNKVIMGENELMVQVGDGTKSSMSQMGALEAGDANDLTNLAIQCDLLAELHYSKFSITPTLKGIEEYNGKDVYVVELKRANGLTIDYFDVQTGLRLKSSTTEEGEEGPISTETYFEEYTTLKNGIKYASVQRQVATGQEFVMKFDSFVLNPKLGDEMFIVK